MRRISLMPTAPSASALVAGIALLAAGGACARMPSSEDGPPLRLSVKLGATTSVNYSTNPRLAATDIATHQTVLQFAPTLRMSVRGPVLNGNVDYAASTLSWAGAPQENSVRHTLRSTAQVNLAGERLGVDGSVQFTQQSQSAFGSPLLGGGLFGGGIGSAGLSTANVFNPNVVDVLSMQVAPVVRARLGTLADVEARYVHTRQEFRGVEDRSQDGQSAQATVTGGQRLRWSLQGLHQRQLFANDRQALLSRAQALWTWPLLDDLNIRAGFGAERQNLQAAAGQPDEQRSTPLLQAGASWVPGPRTLATVDVSDRFFGTGWQFGLNHRFSRLGLRLAGSRNVTDGPLSVSSVNAAGRDATSFSVSELFGQLLTPGEPDSARRDELVAQLLRARGLDGDARVSGISQPFSPSLQERVEFGLAYVLPRQSLSLLAVRTSSENILRNPLNPSDDLARFGGVTQTIVQAGLSHRLTPGSAVSMSLGHTRSEAPRLSRPTILTQAELNGSFRLGPRLQGVLLLREAEVQNALALTSTAGAPRRRDTTAAFVLIPQF